MTTMARIPMAQPPCRSSSIPYTGREMQLALFDREGPLSVEIGPGTGDFLVADAHTHPQRCYLAIEHSPRLVDQLRERVKARGLQNVHILRADARCAIRLIPDTCVDRYDIQFPDPWWKRRHRPRRVLTPELVAEMARTLSSGGQIHFVTDVHEYFVAAQGILEHPSLRLRWADLITDPRPTRFAAKARHRGTPVWGSVHELRN